jgi:hypothetical protein
MLVTVGPAARWLGCGAHNGDIVPFANEVKADLIVMAMHGRQSMLLRVR